MWRPERPPGFFSYCCCLCIYAGLWMTRIYSHTTRKSWGLGSGWGCADKIRWICYKANYLLWFKRKKKKRGKKVKVQLEANRFQTAQSRMRKALERRRFLMLFISHSGCAECLLHRFRPVDTGKSLCRTLFEAVRVRTGLVFFFFFYLLEFKGGIFFKELQGWTQVPKLKQRGYKGDSIGSVDFIHPDIERPRFFLKVVLFAEC